MTANVGFTSAAVAGAWQYSFAFLSNIGTVAGFTFVNGSAGTGTNPFPIFTGGVINVFDTNFPPNIGIFRASTLLFNRTDDTPFPLFVVFNLNALISTATNQVTVDIVDGFNIPVSAPVVWVTSPQTVNFTVAPNIGGSNDFYFRITVINSDATAQLRFHVVSLAIYAPILPDVRNFKFVVNPSNPFFTIAIGSLNNVDSGTAVVQFLNAGVPVGSQFSFPFGSAAQVPSGQIFLTPPSDPKTLLGFNSELGAFTLAPALGTVLFDWSAQADLVTITIVAGLNSAGGRFLTNSFAGVLQTYKA